MTEPAPAAAAGAPAAKRTLRARVLASRAGLTLPQLAAAAAALRDVALAVPAVAGARTVTAYVSVGSEPGTAPLLDALRGRGVDVLLPVLRPDLDLDWAAYAGRDDLVPAGRGLFEPAGPRLGVGAAGAADVLLVPGLAAGRDGARLGRGGGSYDRALARARPTAFVAVLLHDGEVLDGVPAEPHDRPVQAALTPSGAVRLGSDDASLSTPTAGGAG